MYISLPSLHDCDIKFPNFTRPLYGVGEHNLKFFFLFVNLDTVISDSNAEMSPIFDKLNEIE